MWISKQYYIFQNYSESEICPEHGMKHSLNILILISIKDKKKDCDRGRKRNYWTIQLHRKTSTKAKNTSLIRWSEPKQNRLLGVISRFSLPISGKQKKNVSHYSKLKIGPRAVYFWIPVEMTSALERNPQSTLYHNDTHTNSEKTKSWVALVIQNLETTIKTKNFGTELRWCESIRMEALHWEKIMSSTFGK